MLEYMFCCFFEEEEEKEERVVVQEIGTIFMLLCAQVSRVHTCFDGANIVSD